MKGGSEGRVRGERVYTGRVIDVDLDQVRFPDGSLGELELIRHPGAAAIVPLDGLGGGSQPIVTLVHQYRYAAGGYIWEIPAGKLDQDEPPEACARRELEEETGLRAGRLERLSTIYTTPGFTDEVIHLFVAWELEPGRERHGRDEFMEVRRMPLDRVMELIDRGEIADAKTLCALALTVRWLGRASSSVRGIGSVGDAADEH